jgi:toxin ParE1/3/4
VTQIKLTLDAERDLIDIYLYGIENFGHAQAERYAATLNEKMAVAADNPSFGADYSFVRSGLRRRECVSHAIYYHTSANGILVLRILHGRMDPGQHLI